MAQEQSLHDRIAGLTARARMVLAVLATEADDTWIARLSRTDISSRVGLYVGEGIEPTHATRLVREIVDAGLATVVGRDTTKKNVNEIEFQFPPMLILEDPVVRNAVLYEGLTPRESAILSLIPTIEWGYEQGEWPSTTKLAAMAEVSPAIMRKALRKLTEDGYLTAEEGEKPFPLRYTRTDKRAARTH